LLVWQTLTKPQQAFLASRQKDSLYIIGGEAAVSGSMEAALSAYGETTRIGGSNRFETSVKIAEHFFAQPTSAVLAYAWNYPDGLCGGPLASVMGAPLLLTMTGYDAAAVEYASRHTLAGGTILGGETLISPDCAAGILGRMEE
jgi:putative cell wall-binding protein